MHRDSFWTIWFWITHVVAWSLASHFTLGVPYDMVLEAQREKSEDGPWMQAAEAMILAQAFRFTSYTDRFGPILMGVSAFVLSVLTTLGTLGDLEFARAMLTLVFPITLIYIVSIRGAFHIRDNGIRGADLLVRIKWMRIYNQLIGLIGVAMAVTLAIYQAVRDVAIWGF